MIDQLVVAYTHARHRLILLDYDGVLAPIVPKPEQAVPDTEVIDILMSLASHQNTKTVVISGRDQTTLESWFGDLLVDMSAEHGHFVKKDDQWKNVLQSDMSWYEDIKSVMETLIDEYPGSQIEIKQASIVWHYRQVKGAVDKDDVETRINHVARGRAEVMSGKCVVDVRAKGADKGTAVQRWYEPASWDFVLCIGDDVTDEAMFLQLPEDAWTVKVGQGDTAAKYTLTSQREVIDLLRRLSGKGV